MPLTAWLVHRARLLERLSQLEQTLAHRRLSRERHQRLAALWLAVAPYCECPYV